MIPLIIVAIALIAISLWMGPSAVVVFFAMCGLAILCFIGFATYLEHRK